MKVARILTCNKVIVLYSLKGNTRGMLDEINLNNYDFIDISKCENLNLTQYETVLIGTSTYGRGVPPKPFFKFKNELLKLNNKKIGLFGSGNSHYEHYCGALDLLEELLNENNEILFKYKFESYPNKRAKEEFYKLMKEWCDD
ncbi:flavodoxin family protein [Priestia flexa]|uniref:flavodoxin family protein n=1 Tax=Priestia flexa TaxID=86664 RepID=UPI002285C23F|nr:flavodoxin domain-containing protein [Priestia flexa]